MALAAAPFAAQAETWNIYGWQNHSWEFVDIDGGQSFDRIQSNAGNIGFSASVPTGMNDISVNVRCEQFMYVNHYAGGTGWCNRNSKIGLSHPQMGEIMFATWLLPYNEGVAQWVDPFYDAGADSHTSIMGSVGATTIFYNTGEFNGQGDWLDNVRFNYSAVNYDMGFNRRQENIIQYWSPNWNGFVFRFAWTAGVRDETGPDGNLDPVIRSSSLAYTNGPFWGAVTWQDHEDWTAASAGEMNSSDAESFRIAARYIMDMGDGMSVQISAMWEDLEYEFNGVTSVDAAMAAFGYSNFGTYDLLDTAGEIIGMVDLSDITDEDGEFMAPDFSPTSDDVKAQKTYELFSETLFEGFATDAQPSVLHKATTGDDSSTTDVDESGTVSYHLTANDATQAATNGGTTEEIAVPVMTLANRNGNVLADEDADTEGKQNALEAYLMAMQGVLSTARMREDDANTADVDESMLTAAEMAVDAQYNALVSAATSRADAAGTDAHVAAAKKRFDAGATANRDAATKGQNVKIERDAWMVSGKIKFGGPVDFRFSYMDADDLEVSCASCSGDWDETAADAWNVGLFYTMPAGTELRLTYSEVDNDANGTYGQGISGTGLGSPGAEVEMFAVGIVHWFD